MISPPSSLSPTSANGGSRGIRGHTTGQIERLPPIIRDLADVFVSILCVISTGMW
jgi:hypothetical protein